jgi:tetratricopeptide (TPR) repeat protein
MLNIGLLGARLRAAPLIISLLIAAPSVAQPVAKETPGAALARQVRVLASNPRDFNALIGAGHAALALGDVQAAAGFFGRAEEINPNAPAAKAGLGAAMANMGDADGAIFYFNQATRLGAQPLTLALDRGLARDLAGDLGGAQSDYRLAIASLASDEARRRLALSLAIAGNRKGALDAIQPLLNRHDAAAQRTRAFVLALVGDRPGAAQAIEAVMPGGAARFEPFFRYLPNLSVAEKAAAVHLGIFPENAASRTAQAPAATPPPQTVSASAVRPPAPSQPAPVKVASVEPSDRPSSPSPSFNLPSARRATPTVSTPAPAFADPVQSAPEPVVKFAENEPVTAEPGAATAEPSFSIEDLKPAEDEGHLSGIDKLLATMAEAPPAPQPKVEKGPTKAEKAAAAKKAAEKKKRDEKLAAEKKAKEEAARLGVAGTNWVQLAGGSHQDRMASEYKRLTGKAGKLLKSRSGYVTEGKEYFRLLVGPFDSKDDAQDFVNKLAKEGVDGFSWTRTPPKIKIEKLSSR